MEECRLYRKMLCGVVHRDSEHRIVSATIPIHSLKACGLTQGTATVNPDKRETKLEGLRKMNRGKPEKKWDS